MCVCYVGLKSTLTVTAFIDATHIIEKRNLPEDAKDVKTQGFFGVQVLLHWLWIDA